jgi:phosphoadenosine phosphosulfate reductase
MSVFQEISAVSPGMTSQELLRFLLTEKFPGRAVATVSLRAASVAVLKMIADIDPATPVLFCHASDLFPESLAYRELLVKRFGLTNIAEAPRAAPLVEEPGVTDHFECLWWEDPEWGGRVHQIIRLNEMLKPYECWISAVYHMDRPPQARHRVDIEGGIIRVDPLVRWSSEEIRAFLRDNGVPPHPRITHKPSRERPAGDGTESPSYCY